MPTELQSLTKQILVLSRGHESIERGSNVNKTILKFNMNEKSVVSRKLIIDQNVDSEKQSAAFYYRNHK